MENDTAKLELVKQQIKWTKDKDNFTKTRMIEVAGRGIIIINN